ncbi:kinase-like domain-containing protein [Tanacetum coccineum]
MGLAHSSNRTIFTAHNNFHQLAIPVPEIETNKQQHKTTYRIGKNRLGNVNNSNINQNSSTGVKGTIGYAPPEYGIGSEMTSSGDIYSFGILLLEVMTGKKPTDDMFNEGLSLHKFASMALPDHVIDVIDNDAIVLQSTEASAKKVEECLIATIKIGVSCSLDSPPQRMKIEIVVIELQRILEVLQNI